MQPKHRSGNIFFKVSQILCKDYLVKTYILEHLSTEWDWEVLVSSGGCWFNLAQALGGWEPLVGGGWQVQCRVPSVAATEWVNCCGRCCGHCCGHCCGLIAVVTAVVSLLWSLLWYQGKITTTCCFLVLCNNTKSPRVVESSVVIQPLFTSRLNYQWEITLFERLF